MEFVFVVNSLWFIVFSYLQEGDEDQFGEVRDEHSDEDSEGEEADVGSTLTANVSLLFLLNCNEPGHSVNTAHLSDIVEML